MHFHKPKAVKDFVDLAKEVGIIVLGVSIALAAEDWLDHRHWREAVKIAEDDMRLELVDDNGPQAFVRVAIAPCLDAAATRIYGGAGTLPAAELRELARGYAPPFRTWDVEAWRTAIASDVASHMPADRLIAWSEPYRVLPMMTQWSQLESELTTDLQESLPPSGVPTEAELQTLRRNAAALRRVNAKLASRAWIVLVRMKQNNIEIPGTRQQVLLGEARKRYGTCVREPHIAASDEMSQFTTEDEMRRMALGPQ